jgi:fructoselysine-6-P-deglycase FrlB-like protein
MDRVAGLRADIEAGPERLRALADAYAASDAPIAGLADRLAGRRWLFTGLGSSRYAALTAATTLRARGVSAWTEYASTGSPTPQGADLAVIAISASGRTPEVVETARRHRGASLVIAVTNDPSAPLAATADVVQPLHAGSEMAGISTLTYRATVAVLGLLTGDLTALTIRDLADRLDTLDRALSSRIADAADRLDGAPSIDVLAAGAALGTAEQAALMLREAPRLPAHAGETGDWLHTGVYLAFPGHRAIIFAGSASDADVAATIVRRGGDVVAVGTAIAGAVLTIDTVRRDEDGAFERAVLESLVADRLALALWERATAVER